MTDKQMSEKVGFEVTKKHAMVADREGNIYRRGPAGLWEAYE